jgi:catechol 2,3-dioxygenase-like lactoylglutathione lyase family enzyme
LDKDRNIHVVNSTEDVVPDTLLDAIGVLALSHGTPDPHPTTGVPHDAEPGSRIRFSLCGVDLTIIETTGIHHVRLTVTDIDRSKAFYRDVLGFEIALESPGSPADPLVRTDPNQFYGGVVFQTNGMLFGLRPVADPADRFDSERVGLDHLSFTVPSVDDLTRTAARLTEAGIEHGEVNTLAALGIAILSFSDPDGIHLELTAPL